MFRTIVVIATLAHLTGAIDSWSRFDFVQVWSQHTNQILHIYDQLSRFEHSEPVAEWNATRVCRNSIQHLVQDAKEGQFYANKSKFETFFLLPVITIEKPVAEVKAVRKKVSSL